MLLLLLLLLLLILLFGLWLWCWWRCCHCWWVAFFHGLLDSTNISDSERIELQSPRWRVSSVAHSFGMLALLEWTSRRASRSNMLLGGWRFPQQLAGGITGHPICHLNFGSYKFQFREIIAIHKKKYRM